LKKYLVHRNEHAYQTGKSTETAFHDVVTRTGSGAQYKEIALGSFLDIQGAYDRTTFDVITQAAGKHGTKPNNICR
jgi:hypothetical protein